MKTGAKINKRFTLTKDVSKKFYHLVDSLYKKYEDQKIQYLTLKTFQKIEQSLYHPGDRI